MDVLLSAEHVGRVVCQRNKSFLSLLLLSPLLLWPHPPRHDNLKPDIGTLQRPTKSLPFPGWPNGAPAADNAKEKRAPQRRLQRARQSPRQSNQRNAKPSDPNHARHGRAEACVLKKRVGLVDNDSAKAPSDSSEREELVEHATSAAQ